MTFHLLLKGMKLNERERVCVCVFVRQSNRDSVILLRQTQEAPYVVGGEGKARFPRIFLLLFM